MLAMLENGILREPRASRGSVRSMMSSCEEATLQAWKMYVVMNIIEKTPWLGSVALWAARVYVGGGGFSFIGMLRFVVWCREVERSGMVWCGVVRWRNYEIG